MAKKLVSKQKATGAHFTPPGLATMVARRLVAEIGQHENTNFNVLDPSCGEGELLLAFKKELNNNTYQFIGIEEDEESIENAKERLKDCKTKFINGDFLNIVNVNQNISLWENEHETLSEQVDIIIANPPYVRTQVLGADKAQVLAKKFDLSGRVDLYYAFLVAMTSALKPDGLMGVITSNRYLTTQSGASIREFFYKNYEILEIIDLGDTKLFDAAVLPAIFIGRKKDAGKITSKQLIKYFRIYEAQNGDTLKEKETSVPSIYDVLNTSQPGKYEVQGKKYIVSIGHLTVPESFSEPWVLATKNELSWINIVNEMASFTIEDIANVKVGIKTTADSVFIRSDWNQLEEGMCPERELLRPLITSEEAAQWRLEKTLTKRVLYTHEISNGKRKAIDLTKYPRASCYLQSHRKRLEGRDYVIKAKRNWYEIWVPQNPAQWSLPKIVFPDISPEPKFLYDNGGSIVDGNCYWVVLKEKTDTDLLFLILAVANSKFMTKYHDIAFQNKLYAGRRRYLTQYVSKYPIPNPNSEYALQIISLTKKLVFDECSLEERTEILKLIELYISTAFQLDDPKGLALDSSSHDHVSA